MSVAEYVAKYPRRKALFDKVEKYWLDDAYRPPGQLDSSLKKHTTLINRLKSSLLVGPSDTIIKEIDGLVLTKYLEEIAAAIIEGVGRGKGDSEVAVDIIVHLHSRLAPDFLPLLIPSLVALLIPPPPAKDGADREKEDKERIARQRIVLRIIAELAIVHAWAEGPTKGASEVGKILKALMTNDAQFANMPIALTFLKHFNRVYLGAHEGKDTEPLPEGMIELVPVEIQKKMRELFVGYFDTASKTLVKGQTKLLEQDKRNHEAYIKSGEIFEDRQQAYERMTRAVERLTTCVQSLADLLNLTAPTLPTAASLSKSGLQIVNTASSFAVRDDGPIQGGIWDDEEEKRFYENLLDLSELVPPALLGIKDKDKAVEETEETRGKADEEARRRDEEDIRRQLAQLELEQPAPTSGNESTDLFRGPPETPMVQTSIEEELPTSTVDHEDDGLQSGPAARLTALFASMPEAVNRETIDKLCIEFAFLNSKAARKRLVKFIAAVPKTRTDLLPYYSRFIATLDKYMPDVGEGVIESLDEEMRYLQRKRTVRELDQVRLKNVRFFGELAKFRVAKPYTILHVLKVFLDEFKFNVDNIANLLETCGRFLLRFEGTAETAKAMIELMRRKQANSHLDPRHQVMLENAFYQCNPPERVIREVIELTPMQGFIQHLLHDVLMKRTLDKVLKLFRKLHWEDGETYQYILSSFTEIWELKFSNIPYAAALVYDLQRYHPDFGIAVVDQVMEDIRVGMEENIFKFNQRRISSIRYLGELYMYRVVNASVVFETLWSLLSFGHPAGLPVPGRDSPIDSVNDLFRVRLACTLLETCGACFNKGSLKRKLDHYIVVLQLYALCKSDIPMDVEFMLEDTLEMLRPKEPRLKTFAEAAIAMDEIMSTQVDGHEDVEDEESGDETQRGEAVEDEDDVAAGPSNVGPDNIDVTQTQNDDDNEEEEEQVVLIREQNKKRDEQDEQAQGEFDREFARMLADTTVERKTAAPIFDSAVPIIRKAKQSEAIKEEDVEDSGKMQFMLLSKKGNKQQVRSVDIPVDSTIANNLRTNQLASKAEQEQLKRLVLQNEQRQGQSELHDIEQSMRNRGIRVRLVPS